MLGALRHNRREIFRIFPYQMKKGKVDRANKNTDTELQSRDLVVINCQPQVKASQILDGMVGVGVQC